MIPRQALWTRGQGGLPPCTALIWRAHALSQKVDSGQKITVGDDPCPPFTACFPGFAQKEEPPLLPDGLEAMEVLRDKIGGVGIRDGRPECAEARLRLASDPPLITGQV